MFKKFFTNIFTTERFVWLALVCGAAVMGVFYYASARDYREKYDLAAQNNKAYAMQLDKEKNQSNVFRIKAEQLAYYNDSITNILNSTRNELKIKNKQLSSLTYLATQLRKSDTITLTDTIFKELDFILDTTVGDKWISTDLHMQYPNEVALTSSVTSEKSVIMYMEKETIDPPKKWWLLRLFQKKHFVLKAVVKENNPHVTNQENVFFQIID